MCLARRQLLAGESPAESIEAEGYKVIELLSGELQAVEQQGLVTVDKEWIDDWVLPYLQYGNLYSTGGETQPADCQFKEGPWEAHLKSIP